MKPNILMIHCHDLGDYVGCYEGNASQTPNLNRLAEQGVVFKNHFASAPTCSPSRGSMLTGLMPHRNGLMGLASGGHWDMDKNVPTLTEILHDSGYEVVNLGTWHISDNPYEYGVDISDENQLRCEVITDKAISYLENSRNQRPFFLRVGFHEPHLPFTNHCPDLHQFADVDMPHYLKDHSGIREQLSMFYGDISCVDVSVGRLIACLQKLSLESKTLITFTSDHGPGLPFAKCTLYDPGIKIPWIIRWDNRIEGGRQYDGISSNTDFMPTLLELIEEKEKTPQDIDGISFGPYLTKNEKIQRDYVFAEQTWHDFYEPIRAIRTQRYKLIRNFMPGKGLQVGADIRVSPCGKLMADELNSHARPEYELYDLVEDADERNNLVDVKEYAFLAKELKDNLNKWLSETNDPILKGAVKAPAGYWEHFWAKPDGPGGFALNPEDASCVTVKWPASGVVHDCLNKS